MKPGDTFTGQLAGTRYIIKRVAGDRAWVKRWKGRDRARPYPVSEIAKRIKGGAG